MSDWPMWRSMGEVWSQDISTHWLNLSQDDWLFGDGTAGTHPQTVFWLLDPMRPVSRRDVSPAALDPRDLGVLVDEFSRVEATSDAVTQFVSRFGFLGVQPDLRLIGMTTKPGDGLCSCEQMDAWQEASTILRVAWRAYLGEEQEPGEDFRVFRTDAVESDVNRWACQIECSLPTISPRPARLPRPWLFSRSVFAGTQLEQFAGWSFSETSPAELESSNLPTWSFRAPALAPKTELLQRALAEVITGYTRKLVSAQVAVDAKGVPRMSFRSVSLLGEIWMRFAEYLTNADLPRFKSCPECGIRYMATREDQKTCGSSRCRQRVYSRRIEQARELCESGRSAKEIGDAMNATSSQVEKWLSASYRRRKSTKGGS